MANKYSKFTLQPYTSQYVDDGRVQIAGVLRERWQENKANHDKLVRAAGSINVMGQDQEIKDKAIEKVRTDFSGIVENNNYEDALGVVSKATNEFLTNEGIQTAQQSYQNYIEEQKQANTLRMQGINVLFDTEYVKDENGNVMYDSQGTPMTQPKSSSHRSYYQDAVSGKMVKNVYQGTAEAQLNYSQKKQQLIESIATDPIALQRLASKASMNPDALL
jgi:Tfp pilus assembly protein PilE